MTNQTQVLQEALKQAREALESCNPGDYSTGHIVHPSYNEIAVEQAIIAINAALSAANAEQAIVKDAPDWIWLQCPHCEAGVKTLPKYAQQAQAEKAGMTDADFHRRFNEIRLSGGHSYSPSQEMFDDIAAFGHAILRSAPQAAEQDEPLTWESTTPAYTQFVTDSRYRKLSSSIQKWYRPICERCSALSAQDEQQVAELTEDNAWCAFKKMYGENAQRHPNADWRGFRRGWVAALSVQGEQQIAQLVGWADSRSLEKITDFDIPLYAKGGFDYAIPLYTHTNSAAHTTVSEQDKKDAERYRWLRIHVTEAPMNPRAFNSELAPDTRLKFVLPTLVSTTCINSTVSFDDAIDAALSAKAGEDV